MTTRRGEGQRQKKRGTAAAGDSDGNYGDADGDGDGEGMRREPDMRFSQRSQTSSKLCFQLHPQLHLATFERLMPFLRFTPHLRGLVVHFPAETHGVQWSLPRETALCLQIIDSSSVVI